MHQGLRENQAHQGNLDQMALEDRRDHQACVETQSRDLRARLVPKGTEERVEAPVCRALLDPRDLRVKMDCKDYWASKDLMGTQDPLDLRALGAFKDCPD